MHSFRSGFVGVLGQTNVGKSTFLNAIMGTKLLITSPKPQTTRNRVCCIYTTEEAQVVFVDTPGLHRPRNRLGRHILREAFRALRGLDLLVYMVEPWRTVSEYERLLLARVTRPDRPTILLVNKIDLARGNDLEETLLAYDATGLFAELVPISATRGTNRDEALSTITAHLPAGRPHFPPGVRVDRSEEFLVGELIREKIIQHTAQEIPYATAVEVKWMTVREDGLLEIRADAIVEKESQKAIIIGSGASMIKQIGTEARADIESLLGTRVFLDLQAKVVKGWTKDKEKIERLAGEGASLGPVSG